MGLINNVGYGANASKKSAIGNCAEYLKPVEMTDLLMAMEGYFKVILEVPFLSFSTPVFWILSI